MRNTSIYVCQKCGFKSPQFLGKCPECQAWNSIAEEYIATQRGKEERSVKNDDPKIINLADIKKEHYGRLNTGIYEFDRVLGGGIVPGCLVLLAGDPGVGKSTLMLQLALNVNTKKQDVLYVSGEESAHQIKIRADRIQNKAKLNILNEVDIDLIIHVISSSKPSLVIVDSIQTMQTSDFESVAGSVSQVRECAHRLQIVAKQIHIPIFLIGHVTKEGTVAGPKTLEHLVDVVLSLEGDPESMLRILRGSKNRFGSTQEAGIFDMENGQMVEVKNPSRIFLQSQNLRVNTPGWAVVPTLTGLRPILMEIQALATKSNLPVPRRIAQGIDANRLVLLTAVLSKRLGLNLFDQDIFVNVAGGVKVSETACDLGVCAAIASSLKDVPVKPKTALIGEVGLLGELRNVREVEKRIAEAKKLGYNHIIVPGQVKTLADALKLALV